MGRVVAHGRRGSGERHACWSGHRGGDASVVPAPSLAPLRAPTRPHPILQSTPLSMKPRVLEHNNLRRRLTSERTQLPKRSSKRRPIEPRKHRASCRVHGLGFRRVSATERHPPEGQRHKTSETWRGGPRRELSANGEAARDEDLGRETAAKAFSATASKCGDGAPNTPAGG